MTIESKAFLKDWRKTYNRLVRKARKSQVGYKARTALLLYELSAL